MGASLSPVSRLLGSCSGVVRSLGCRATVLGLCLGGPLACDPCPVEPYPEGTKLTVTVPNSYEGCHVTFAAGHTYTLVAGAIKRDNEDCEDNRAELPPEFTTSEYELGACRQAIGGLAIDCDASLPGCPDDSYSSIRFHYGPLPEERGDVVSATLRFTYVSPMECTSECAAQVPVTIRW